MTAHITLAPDAVREALDGIADEASKLIHSDLGDLTESAVDGSLRRLADRVADHVQTIREQMRVVVESGLTARVIAEVATTVTGSPHHDADAVLDGLGSVVERADRTLYRALTRPRDEAREMLVDVAALLVLAVADMDREAGR